MYTMYGGDSVWLATSQDGVHWKDYGVVLKSEGFKEQPCLEAVRCQGWRPVHHGLRRLYRPKLNNNLLRFYESTDLIHWKFLYEIPIDTHYYRADGRWDHMFMIPKDEANPGAGYSGVHGRQSDRSRRIRDDGVR